jgi:hypothetical protein
MARVVVIGDVGGHPDQLVAVLERLGPRGTLPPDVVVVQVGDLVDRGPDSALVLAIVDGFMRRHPGQWIQLVGNHESQYLPGGTRFWPEELSPIDARLLRSWWEDGLMTVAAALRTADGDELLVTHAGLTVECWQELGEPMTAASAVWLLNELHEKPDLLFRGNNGAVDRGAGPLWAEAGWELHEPWLEYYSAGGFVPFGQVHGHSTIVRFADQTYRCPGRVRQRATVDWEARHVRVRVGGRMFTGVDPKHGRTGATSWRPLILEDASVLTPSGS